MDSDPSLYPPHTTNNNYSIQDLSQKHVYTHSLHRYFKDTIILLCHKNKNFICLLHILLEKVYGFFLGVCFVLQLEKRVIRPGSPFLELNLDLSFAKISNSNKNK